MGIEKTYRVDWDKVKTVKDVKALLQACSLEFVEDPLNPIPAFDPIRDKFIVEDSSDASG